jgi:hypothetical protein
MILNKIRIEINMIIRVNQFSHAGALIGARNVRKLGQPTGPHARTYGHGTTPAATPGIRDEY